jgi:uncharacterized protein with HEPN domain
MQRDPRAFLWDVREAALAIQAFTAGMDAAGFDASPLVQAAVERKFEVIGEALNQLIHGYATVSTGTVWNIAQDALPKLAATVQGLLDELQ